MNATAYRSDGPTARWGILIYGIVSYLIFFATFLYAIGFIGNLLVPTSLDGPRTMGLVPAIAIDLGLLALFAVQHSVMARPAFKRWWTRIVPPPAERSTYVLLSSLALIALFAFWQPLGGRVWNVENAIGQAMLYGGYAFGWILVLVSTFLTSHWDLFGLRQVWLNFRRRPYAPLKFVTPLPYRIVRHPLYVGWLFVFWCTPDMTISHLLFAVMTSAYIVIGATLEERDLVAEHGDAYEQYRRRVPMLIPGVRRRAWAPSDSSATLGQ